MFAKEDLNHQQDHLLLHPQKDQPVPQIHQIVSEVWDVTTQSKDPDAVHVHTVTPVMGKFGFEERKALFQFLDWLHTINKW